MADIIPVGVPYRIWPADQSKTYVCDGCTYNKGPGAFFPKDTVICALAMIEGDEPTISRRRSAPCGYVNPCPRYIGDRLKWYQLVG